MRCQGSQAQTTLYALDHSKNELWSISTSPPLTSTLIGGANSVVIIAEIEEGGGVIYGADTDVNNWLHWIDPDTAIATDLGPTNIPGPIALTEGSLIFADGFESGDTAAWSSSVP